MDRGGVLMDAVFDPDLDDNEVCVARIAVYRIIDSDGGMRDDVRCDGGDDDAELDLPTAVGMLAIAQHTLLCEDE
jgi:hypothetical protein